MRKKRTPLKHKYSDGGRRKAGFRGFRPDCFTRALAIAYDAPYAAISEVVNESCRVSRRHGCYSHAGIRFSIANAILKHNGWRFHGLAGKRKRACREDLPRGKLILVLNMEEGRKGGDKWPGKGVDVHIACVKDKTVLDHANWARDMPPLLGYFTKKRRKPRKV